MTLKSYHARHASLGSGVCTVAELRRLHRRTDGHRIGANRIVAELRLGASLTRTFQSGRVVWRLGRGGGGQFVPTEIAELVTRRPDVAGVGDSLFGADLSQTFRYVDPNPKQGA